jgi:hypothetical protein
MQHRMQNAFSTHTLRIIGEISYQYSGRGVLLRKKKALKLSYSP